MNSTTITQTENIAQAIADNTDSQVRLQAEPHTVANPTTTPSEIEVENPAERPGGMGWCDCGESHELDDLDITLALEEVEGEDFPESVTHPHVCDAIQALWYYDSVCNFFFDHVALSARKAAGRIKPEYPMAEAEAIVRYFSDTWQGCPEEACEEAFYESWEAAQ